MPVPPVDEHVTVTVELTVIDVVFIVEVFVNPALFTLTIISFLLIVPFPSLTFTAIV